MMTRKALFLENICTVVNLFLKIAWNLYIFCLCSSSLRLCCFATPVFSCCGNRAETQQAVKHYFKVKFRTLLQDVMYWPIRTYPFHLWGSPLCHQLTSESRGTRCNLHRASSPWCICSTSHHAPSISSFQSSPARSHPGLLPHWCHMSPPLITPHVNSHIADCLPVNDHRFLSFFFFFCPSDT